jgi:hypothetical protein
MRKLFFYLQILIHKAWWRYKRTDIYRFNKSERLHWAVLECLLIASYSRLQSSEPGVKVKIKFALEQIMKAQRRSRGIALLFP